MSLEFDPRQKSQEKDEKDLYTLERLPIIDHALLGLSFGVLAVELKRNFPLSTQVCSKESGEKNGLLKYFAERSLKGYRFIEEISEIIDENKFEKLRMEYGGRIEETKDENEKDRLQDKWEKVLKLRERMLEEEKARNETLNSVLGAVKKIFN